MIEDEKGTHIRASIIAEKPDYAVKDKDRELRDDPKKYGFHRTWIYSSNWFLQEMKRP